MYDYKTVNGFYLLNNFFPSFPFNFFSGANVACTFKTASVGRHDSDVNIFLPTVATLLRQLLFAITFCLVLWA